MSGAGTVHPQHRGPALVLDCGWETERVAWWLGTVSECVTVLRLASSWEYVRGDLWVSESGSGSDSEKDIVLDTSLGTELDIVWGTEWVSM